MFKIEKNEIPNFQEQTEEILNFSYQLVLSKSRYPNTKYFIPISSENISEMSNLIPKLANRAETIWANSNWLMLEIGETPGHIPVFSSEYFDRLINFGFRFFDARSSQNFVENFIYTHFCSIDNAENAAARLNRQSPMQCALDSGMVRFDNLAG